MNKTATVSLLAASALLFTPKPAVAGDKELAAIGGFIGGLIIGSQIDNNHHRRVVVQPACPPPARVVIQTGGYWDYRPIRVWVAPRWTVIYDSCNRPVRRYIAGHYETRRERVWVAHRGGYDRHDDRRSARHDRNDHRRDRHDRRDRW